jgi:hypothetical protein
VGSSSPSSLPVRCPGGPGSRGVPGPPPGSLRALPFGGVAGRPFVPVLRAFRLGSGLAGPCWWSWVGGWVRFGCPPSLARFAGLPPLSPEVVVGAEGLEPWCLSGTPGAIGSPYHDRCASDGKLEAVSPEHEPTLTPDTIVPCGWPGCDVPVRLGKLACDAHLDEMNIAAQLSRDRRCPDCGEPSPFGVLLHRCSENSVVQP